VNSELIVLSDILIGDLVTSHGPTDAFEYVGSVLLIDDTLMQVDLPKALGGYPNAPSSVHLSAEEISSLRDASSHTLPAEELLSLLDDDTFIPAGDAGLANLTALASGQEPGLPGDGDLQEDGAAARAAGVSEGSPALVVLVLVLLVVLLAAGAWIAIRAVSGY
jgi:hypothetical protein